MRWLSPLGIFLNLLWMCRCQGYNVSQPQGRVEALERSNVTLVCVLSSETPLGPVRWYKGAGSERTHFYSALPKGGDKNDPRVNWTMENPTVNYSITIRDLRVSDTEEYYCEKYTKADENKPNAPPYATGPGVTLTVRGVPIITGPASRVKVGNDLNLTCEVNGASNITVKWFKDEQEVTPELRDTSGGGKSSRSVIRLTPKIQDIKSVIRCQESGLSAQNPLEDKFHLKDVIAVLPGVPVIENPKLVLGDLVNMTCKLSLVYPKDIKVTWTWDKTFESSQSPHAEEHEDGTFTVTSVLSFTVKEDMRGTRLTCQAGYEGLTPVSGAVTLGVRGPPSIKGPQNRVDTGQTVSFTCESLGDQDTSITWLKGETTVSGGQKMSWSNGTRSELKMTLYKNDVKSRIYCQILGYRGGSVPSDALNFSTFILVKPEVTIQKTSAEDSHNSSSFYCKISGFYPDDIKVIWLLEGQTLNATLFNRSENLDGTFTAFTLIDVNVTNEVKQLNCVVTHMGNHNVSHSVEFAKRSSGDVSDGSSGSGLKINIHIVIGVLVAFVILCVIFTVFLYCRKTSQRKKASKKKSDSNNDVNTNTEVEYATLDLHNLQNANKGQRSATEPTEYAEVYCNRSKQNQNEEVTYASVVNLRAKPKTDRSQAGSTLQEENTEYAAVNFKRKTKRLQDSMLYY
ncbi:tyrosine-protein phosphatase non-receptor type substrate 1-like [Polypterus senegalus]|uniref:tyrosine-protein phosphatase non-receptor type substrate 1-like n=1 Tax=Polypterus senegalus TaxID=55291 RepID=UPI001962F1EF|nr:tyrosine-protein phosphatase non-receptor type substrate 1-like [Polypterus senegalus]XP_039623381.1 tyrosine-protein phosphatase non-receptor type substrate 1-like [Polypterus senegalus]XP_039623383.1 tyrosine-protein phosphatase non-receptor type substrate 1-like [Polypterus senegalus]